MYNSQDIERSLVNIISKTYEPVHEISNTGMCIQQSLRSACAYAQSDQSLCKSLEYSISVMLLVNNIWSFYTLKEAVQARLSLHLSKCHIVENHLSRLILHFSEYLFYLGKQCRPFLAVCKSTHLEVSGLQRVNLQSEGFCCPSLRLRSSRRSNVT